MSENAGDSSEQAGDVQSELLNSVDTVLRVLKAVGIGDLTQRLEVRFPESHPVGALVASVNSMMEELAEARETSAKYLNELGDRIEVVERQREAIRTLSTPIIEIWAGVLCAPIVGVFDGSRAADVMSTLLTAVVERRVQHVIIDVTGIDAMDTQSADHFLRLARAVTLLGARCALSGMHPNIARTIVHLGVDLGGLKSYRTMRDALKHCIKAVYGPQQRNAKTEAAKKVRQS